MTDQQTTASAIISFSEALEDAASGFYEVLGDRFPTYHAVFSGFAEESRKHRVLLTRTYRETVSDALETGFAFEGLDLRDYRVDTTLAEEISLTEALDRALKMEEKAVSFYLKVADQSRSLLATIPRAFRRVARKRNDRRQALQSLSGGQ
jgi:rubrerythrin